MCNSGRKLSNMKAELDAEMAKCDLLCQNCHQKETRARNTI